MAVRNVVRIDEAKCDGCGLCVTACAEGAIQVIDGKARLVSELYCDGLGACLGECPQGAITVEKAEAAAFDEAAVARHLAALGRTAGPAHQPQTPLPAIAFRATAVAEATLPLMPAAAALPMMPVIATRPPLAVWHDHGHGGGCPGSRAMAFAAAGERPGAETAAGLAVAGAAPSATAQPSMLRQWPVQLHLVSPLAPSFAGADVLLAADCTAYALGDFHSRWLAGRALAIACPKLDQQQEVYLDKLIAMIDQAAITSLTVLIMQVPCCSGLLRLAQMAVAQASRTVPLRAVVVSPHGEVLQDISAA